MTTYSHVVKRLDLLGYTLVGCERKFDEVVQSIPEYYPKALLTFHEFAGVLRRVDVARVRVPDEPAYYDLGEYVARNILDDPQFAGVDRRLANLSSEAGTFFENLDPYVALRLLAENPANLDRDLVWRFSDAVDGGWACSENLYEGPGPADRILVVTEGSSDSAILAASLPEVEPDVVDFFDFIDMAEHYPFTGTGNLLRFCQGLARIRIRNRLLVVLDNDAAGCAVYRQLMSMARPETMLVTKLPDLEEFKAVRTIGPSGEATEEVNGRAVASECFLDLRCGHPDPPAIRWTAYNEQIGQYQGSLIEKESYIRSFFGSARREGGYDLSKRALLWAHLLNAATGETPNTAYWTIAALMSPDMFPDT